MPTYAQYASASLEGCSKADSRARTMEAMAIATQMPRFDIHRARIYLLVTLTLFRFLGLSKKKLYSLKQRRFSRERFIDIILMETRRHFAPYAQARTPATPFRRARFARRHARADCRFSAHITTAELSADLSLLVHFYHI